MTAELTAEVTAEVKQMRLEIRQYFMELKDFKRNGEMPDAAHILLGRLEASIERLKYAQDVLVVQVECMQKKQEQMQLTLNAYGRRLMKESPNFIEDANGLRIEVE